MPPLFEGLVYYVVFLYSVSFHEAAHAWAALRGGDRTAYEGGQVTLDPRPHIRREPVGMVALPIISVMLSGWPLGFASAPYDPDWAERHPDRSGWMSLAGPAANMIVALGAALALTAGLATGVFTPPDSINFGQITEAAEGMSKIWSSVSYLLGAVFSMNLLLAIFNLLPVPPLDGSGGLVLLLPAHQKVDYLRRLSVNPQLALFGLFIAWQVFSWVFDPVFTASVNLMYMPWGVSYG